MSDITAIFGLYFGSAVILILALIFFQIFIGQDARPVESSKKYRVEFRNGKYTVLKNYKKNK